MLLKKLPKNYQPKSKKSGKHYTKKRRRQKKRRNLKKRKKKINKICRKIIMKFWEFPKPRPKMKSSALTENWRINIIPIKMAATIRNSKKSMKLIRFWGIKKKENNLTDSVGHLKALRAEDFMAEILKDLAVYPIS